MNEDKSGAPRKSRVAARLPAGRSQVAAACKKIARFIHQHGLGVGDTLPPQTQLRRILGFSNNTLDPAMRLLADMGLLVRRTCRGTEILSLEPLNRLTWTVGLAVMDLPIRGPGAFYAWLQHAMQRELSKRQCTSHTYFRVENYKWPHHRLEDFPGFAADVEDRAIDGMIIFSSLDAQGQSAFAAAGIPLLHCSSQSEMPLATLVDSGSMVTGAVRTLLGQGARRLALVASSINEREFADIVRREAGAQGGSGRVTEVFRGVPGAAVGEGVARTLLQRPEASRSDALIIDDDYTAMGAARVLAAQDGYRPRFAVQGNKQLPQAWPMPVLLFELDIDEVAACAVRMLQKAMLDPGLPPRQERVPVRLVCGEEKGDRSCERKVG